MSQLSSEIEVDCPCCGSMLIVDVHLRRVVSHREPERDDKPVLEDARQILDSFWPFDLRDDLHVALALFHMLAQLHHI